MAKLLSDDAVAAYRRDGYIFPVDVLSADETLELRRKLEAYERSIGRQVPQGTLSHLADHRSRLPRSTRMRR